MYAFLRVGLGSGLFINSDLCAILMYKSKVNKYDKDRLPEVSASPVTTVTVAGAGWTSEE